jgi:hypothetical protein
MNPDTWDLGEGVGVKRFFERALQFASTVKADVDWKGGPSGDPFFRKARGYVHATRSGTLLTLGGTLTEIIPGASSREPLDLDIRHQGDTTISTITGERSGVQIEVADPTTFGNINLYQQFPVEGELTTVVNILLYFTEPSIPSSGSGPTFPG